MVQYIRFGLMDNLVMIFAGSLIESGIRKVLNKVTGNRIAIRNVKAYMLFIASVGNACSDYLGGLASGSSNMANGTFIGCIIVSVCCIPFIYTITRR